MRTHEYVILYFEFSEEDNNNCATKQRMAHFGSFYLRVGAISFGIGSMVYCGLELGQYFESYSEFYTCQVFFLNFEQKKNFCHSPRSFVQTIMQRSTNNPGCLNTNCTYVVVYYTNAIYIFEYNRFGYGAT